jgi:AraC-like DNA-binding protein
MRAEWIHTAVNVAQVSDEAWLTDDLKVSDIVGHLASRIPDPHGPLERIISLYLIQRTAWNILHRRLELGTASHIEAVHDFQQILTMTETLPWVEASQALQVCSLPSFTSLPLRIRRFLDSHIRDTPTIATAAQSTGCCARTATTSFRARYGLTVHQYLTRSRLQKALQLLLSTDMKVSAIADEVGLKAKSTLHRQFVRVLGTTPECVRKALTSAQAASQRIALPPE